MDGDRFEEELKGQAMRPVPADWRRQILAAAGGAVAVEVVPPEASRCRWSAWFLPNRLAWGTLAVAWIVILTLNWAANRPGGAGAVESVYSPGVVAMALQQSQQIAETLGGADGVESIPSIVPGPRSAIASEPRAV